MQIKIDYLVNKFKESGLDITKEQAKQFIKYYELLVEWNSFMNLTAIVEYEEVVLKHFIDSVSLYKIVDLTNINNLIDVGTGAGFPAIPLKIMYPHLKVTMIDSLNKRVKFLNEVIMELGLTDIVALHGRAEDYARDASHREKYDLAVSRAVANLSTLSEYCLPYVKVGGSFIAYKSEKLSDEAKTAQNAIKLLSGKYENQVEYTLPDSDIYRILCEIKKVNKLHSKYPRKAGLPGKEPL